MEKEARMHKLVTMAAKIDFHFRMKMGHFAEQK